MKTAKWNRKLHRWGAVFVALPVIIVIVTGVLLQFKKQSDWIQPPTITGTAGELTVSFDRILEIARTVPEAGVTTWDDIDRLDVRPGKGIVKVRCKNRREVQIDTANGEVLQVSVRRSDLIESIHDGSFFFEGAKVWVFFPAALILTGLWGTGLYLFIRPYIAKRGRSKG
ncbi:MAG: PepSY domain-containing protein [Candidatus Latescibacterota bacterium]|nr:MAG: PepSY domain-containing protein [Candidatus Latescibacterota bacterium]